MHGRTRADAFKGDAEFEDDLANHFYNFAGAKRETVVRPVLEKAARVALRAHVIPSIENEFHKQLKEIAADYAFSLKIAGKA